MARFINSEAVARSSSGRVWQRIGIACLLTISITMLIFARHNHPSIQQARAQAIAFFAPVVQVVNAPIETVNNVMNDWSALLQAHQINAALRKENDQLRQWQSVAVSLARENTSLRALARYQPVAETSYISAKVISGAQTAFSQHLWLSVGAANGVKPYQPVIDAHGLLGRTLEVSEHTAKLMLITDPNSRIPVTVGTANERAVVAGAKDGAMELLFLPLNHRIKLGDAVITSDDGGLMPAAIMIGKVSAINGKTVTVTPARPVQVADYVRVIQYSAPHAGIRAKP